VCKQTRTLHSIVTQHRVRVIENEGKIHLRPSRPRQAGRLPASVFKRRIIGRMDHLLSFVHLCLCYMYPDSKGMMQNRVNKKTKRKQNYNLIPNIINKVPRKKVSLTLKQIDALNPKMATLNARQKCRARSSPTQHNCYREEISAPRTCSSSRVLEKPADIS
jgi:hypothetical protein